jgi:tetratricopeptide (TPR) repeat protein
VPGLKGDLEMILMKGLRKEPQERYATIEQFSDDLENYLESCPIRARKGDTWYRARKFLRRYWLPVAAATLAVGGLATGLAVVSHERAIAQRRFLEVRQLANKLLDIDIEARKIVGSTKTRQLIVDTSLEYLRRLSEDSQMDPGLALEVGNAYMRVARVQGVPISANLGQMDKAEQNLRIAEKLIHSAVESQPPNRISLLRSAQIAHDRMVLARLNNRDEEALALARKSAEWLEKFNAGTGDKPESSAILNTYLNVADQHMLGRQFDEARSLCRRASELALSFNNQPYVGNFLWVSAEAFRRQGNLDQALKEIRQSVKFLEPGAGNADQIQMMNFIFALIKESRILGEDGRISLGRSEEAVAVLERAFRMADGFVHQDANDQNSRGRLALAGLGLANILRHSNAPRALEIYDHTFRHMNEIGDNSSFRRYEVSALAGSSYALRGLGRPAEARERIETAFERLRQIKAYPVEKIKPGSELDQTLCALADYEGGRGNIPEAIAIYKKLLGQTLAWGPKPDSTLADAVDVSRLYSALAALHRRAGEASPASALEARRLQLWRGWDTRLPRNNFVRRQLNEANGPSGERL